MVGDMTASEKYSVIWKQFAVNLRSIYEEIGNTSIERVNSNLHEQLRAMYGVPYEEVREALKSPAVDATSGNIGAITGLFFEQAATALIVPTLRQQVPTVQIERNTCSSKKISTLAPNPDLYAFANGNDAVIEFKVSPKKENLEQVLLAHEKHLKKGVGYFFIGGEVRSNAELLQRFGGDTPWACFLDCSYANQYILKKLPKLDDVIESLVDFLRSA